MAFSAAIGESFGQVSRVLFSPFSFSKWLRLALIAFIAGSLSGGGCALQSAKRAVTPPEKPAAESRSAESEAAEPAAGEAPSEKAADAAGARYKFVDGIFRPDFSQYSVSPWWLAVVLVPLLLILLAILVTCWAFGVWLAVRFKFMWLRAVREGESGIRALYAATRQEADDFFDFWIIFSAIEIFAYFSVFAWLVWSVFAVGGGWHNRIEWTPALGWKVVAPPLAAGLIFWLVFSLVRTIGDDFLVPLSARNPGLGRRVWTKWAGIYRRARGSVWRYLLVRFILGIAWGIFQGAALILFILGWVVVFGICFGLFGWAAAVWTFLKPYFPVYFVILGLPLIAVLLAGLAAVVLPAAVFFRDYSVRMLDRLEPPEAA